MTYVENAEINAFQSTCPARGTTPRTMRRVSAGNISIHVPREGHDQLRARGVSGDYNFNPRAPRGARRRKIGALLRWRFHFNPRAPRGARLVRLVYLRQAGRISIHVPREGHDDPHRQRHCVSGRFQSTCPARGTTNMILIRHITRNNFNPRAPRGARQQTCTIFSCRFAQELQISR